MSRPEPITATEHTYTVLLQPEPEGGFTVTCPTLPGLVTYGASVDEARAMAGEAIACYLESLQKDGLPIPESDARAAPRAEPVVQSRDAPNARGAPPRLSASPAATALGDSDRVCGQS
jgi:antitoxin HicB